MVSGTAANDNRKRGRTNPFKMNGIQITDAVSKYDIVDKAKIGIFSRYDNDFFRGSSFIVTPFHDSFSAHSDR